MPTYEYRCNNCGHEMETVQKISEPALKLCPECNQEKLERLISGGAFHLKGAGWAKDNYSQPKGGHRSEKTVQDRLTKAVNEDKAKEAAKKTE